MLVGTLLIKLELKNQRLRKDSIFIILTEEGSKLIKTKKNVPSSLSQKNLKLFKTGTIYYFKGILGYFVRVRALLKLMYLKTMKAKYSKSVETDSHDVKVGMRSPRP